MVNKDGFPWKNEGQCQTQILIVGDGQRPFPGCRRILAVMNMTWNTFYSNWMKQLDR